MEGVNSQNSSWVNPGGTVRWWEVGSQSGGGSGIEDEASGFGSAIEEEKGKTTIREAKGFIRSRDYGKWWG